MGEKVVTFEEMVDLAIGTPGCAINFCVLKKLLKLFSRYCCEKDYTFEIDMDNLSAEAKVISKQSRSSIHESRESHENRALLGRNDTSEERSMKGQIKIKSERDVQSDEYEDENVRVKAEKGSQVYSSEGKMYDSSSDITKESGSVDEKQSESSELEDSAKDHEVKEKKDKKHKKESDDHRKKDESKHKKKSSDDVKKKASKKRKEGQDKGQDDFSNELENQTNELQDRMTQLSDRIENITETIGTHLNAEHLAEINNEIDKLKKSAEVTSDQCYETANSINDQSTQIQDILTTINDIQLRKVENEELIDLLSGKADYSFVDEKVSTSHFEEKIQELKDVIGESAEQLEAFRLETNTSLEQIKVELQTKLLAEEFDEAKGKIYKELIKLTEQHALILAQQNEHVAAGAKMRNLNCFVCENDVVMLLEQETIPKFRSLKPSPTPLERIVGSKVLIDKSAPEWKNHLLQTRTYSRDSKASRFHSNVDYKKPTYVKGKNGCMYKGNVGCDCREALNDIAKGGKYCCMVDAKNMKNISLTNRMNSESKASRDVVIGDVLDDSCENDKDIITQTTPTEQQEEKSNIKVDGVETAADITVKLEAPVETVETTTNVANSVVIEIKKEIVTTTKSNSSSTTKEGNGILVGTKDGMSTIKTENDKSETNDDAPVETNKDTREGDDAAVNQ